MSITDDSVADIRWRLEDALENLDDALWRSALERLIEARLVLEGLISRVDADKHAEAAAARASHNKHRPKDRQNGV